MDKTDIAVFSGKRVRRQLFNNEWNFSIVDVIEILTDSNIPRRYWSDLKRKLKEEGYVELYENIVQLRMEASDGKKYETDCTNTEGIFRDKGSSLHTSNPDYNYGEFAIIKNQAGRKKDY